MLLPDGPDAALKAGLGGLGLRQLGTELPQGAPACFNRLIGATESRLIVLLESGSLVTRGWLELLLAGLAKGPTHGLAGPSTNLCWNEQARGPRARSDRPEEIARIADQLAAGGTITTHALAPLHSLADFCYLVRREVVEAIGAADEAYGLGPCWEMDYNIRAARAGFAGVWVREAYVHRLPYPARRRTEELRRFEASRRRYQDKFCGFRLRNERPAGRAYEPHCKGDACAEFAPLKLITLREGPGVPAARSEPSPQLSEVVPSASPPASASASAPAPVSISVSAAATPSGPLVTCIMPTWNRGHFVPQAIRYFLRQDLTDSELVIVDDGSEPVASLVPAHPRVRYVRLEGSRLTVGEKRNRACALASGTFIAHWDDDDWYPPWRLSRQIEALSRRQAELCGTRSELFYDPAADRAWCYDFGGAARNFLTGTSLVYRRALWQRQPFDDVRVGEDLRFVSRAVRGGGALVDLAEPRLAVGIVHQGNTSPKRTLGAYWRPAPAASIHALLGEDLGFYRPPAPPADPIAPELVSCIMPTRDRRAFVEHSLRLFAAQDYPHRELVVVDDGKDAVADLVEGFPGTRYLRLPQRVSIGGKRNLACAAARGAVIVHWDDDDWHGPGRLSRQAAPILNGLCDITGLESRFVLELPSERFWALEPSLHRKMFTGDVHGGTLAYHRALYEQGLRYPPVNLAEDAAFLRAALHRGRRLLRLPGDGVFVYVRHGTNAWRFQAGRFVDGGGWIPVATLPEFPEQALLAYREIVARGSVAAEPRAPLVHGVGRPPP
ncbi:MAG TPA: glycosyltransferase [Polyangia bacterium]|nr:glycosyltransferase [Polyangia bacterium]